MKLSYRKKQNLLNIIYMMIVFIAALNLFNFLRYFGLEELSSIGKVPLPFTELLFNGFLGGALAGIFIGTLDNILNNARLRKRSFGYIVIFKSFCFITAFILLVIIVFNTTNTIFGLPPGISLMDKLLEFLTSRTMIVHLFYGMIIIVLINIFKEANRKIGPGIMLKLFTGKYHRPVEEDRIFMFLDLKSSTTIAEKLGHFKYSRLIQEIFFDMNEIAGINSAGIYQYVGDEAVLTWKIDQKTNPVKCLEMFFGFEDLLQKKKAYYTGKYGVLPEFKAGVNCGKVMVAEVGEIKSEIAYHGDVLNTAARIQGLCNQHGKKLLVSENLKNLIDNKGYDISLIGTAALRGRVSEVNIYSVERKPSSEKKPSA